MAAYQSFEDLLEKHKALKVKYDELVEVATPFVFHGKALGAMERTDISTPVSQEGSSYLCLGAFQILMDTLMHDLPRLRGMCGWCGTPEAIMSCGFKVCESCHSFVVSLGAHTRRLIRQTVSAVRRRAMVEQWHRDTTIQPGTKKARQAAKPLKKRR